MKAIFLASTILMIALALNSEGLVKALAELFAFLSLISFVVSVKHKRKVGVRVEAEEL
ncbi:hypothetical protein L4D20_09645 [Vibrio kyushuensis]|uniref:hypothetical protein n=1 Tax=Vibrio kyushuensis TaxID=2910249 RepID=UPI003D10F4D8